MAFTVAMRHEADVLAEVVVKVKVAPLAPVLGVTDNHDGSVAVSTDQGAALVVTMAVVKLPLAAPRTAEVLDNEIEIVFSWVTLMVAEAVPALTFTSALRPVVVVFAEFVLNVNTAPFAPLFGVTDSHDGTVAASTAQEVALVATVAVVELPLAAPRVAVSLDREIVLGAVAVRVYLPVPPLGLDSTVKR